VPLLRFLPTSLKDAAEMDAELARFCIIARGSASEPEYELLLARDLKLLQPNDYETLSQQTIEIKRMLTVLVRS
jgi:four helix bundle protein